MWSNNQVFRMQLKYVNKKKFSPYLKVVYVISIIRFVHWSADSIHPHNSPISLDSLKTTLIMIGHASVQHDNLIIKYFFHTRFFILLWLRFNQGGGLFIGDLNDMRGSLWNETSYIQEVYGENQMYMY